jgi:hypothetical protein
MKPEIRMVEEAQLDVVPFHLPLLRRNEGGEGWGEEALLKIPLSPALSPLLRRGERETTVHEHGDGTCISFGVRISVFGLLSDFGVRISELSS